VGKKLATDEQGRGRKKVEKLVKNFHLERNRKKFSLVRVGDTGEKAEKKTSVFLLCGGRTIIKNFF